MTSFEFTARSRFALLAPRVKRAAEARIESILTITGRGRDRRDSLASLSSAVAEFTSAELWLSFAVLHGELPVASMIRRTRRIRELDGSWAAVANILAGLPRTGPESVAPVSIVGNSMTLLDVTGLLADATAMEGRGVARQFAREWMTSPTILPVTWNDQLRGLRELSSSEAEKLGVAPSTAFGGASLVPHDSRYVLVGTVDIPRASARLIALGEESLNRTSSLGYGLRPLLDAQSYRWHDGEQRFSWHVAAQRSFDSLAVIGEDVVNHYRGWELMLPAIGHRGPTLHTFPLPVLVGEASSATDSADAWKQLARSVGSAIGIYESAATQP